MPLVLHFSPTYLPLPAAPADEGGRATYVKEHAPKTHFLKQGTKAWHAF